jgi:hypothetical protein
MLQHHFAPSVLRSFSQSPPGPVAQAFTFRALGAENRALLTDVISFKLHNYYLAARQCGHRVRPDILRSCLTLSGAKISSAFFATRLAMIGSTDARPGKTTLAAATTIKPGTKTSFGSLKQIDAGVLNVGYAETGPADGPAVIRWSHSNCASNSELLPARS